MLRRGCGSILQALKPNLTKWNRKVRLRGGDPAEKMQLAKYRMPLKSNAMRSSRVTFSRIIAMDRYFELSYMIKVPN